MNILTRITSEPWSILHPALTDFRQTLSARVVNPATAPTVQGRADIVGPCWGDGTPVLPQLEEVYGLGIIRVKGVLVNGCSWIDALFGAYSYEWLAQFLAQAAASPRVRAAVIIYDTPGGSCAGGDEAVDSLAQFRAGGKPIIAFTSTVCCSMGLRLAMEADAFYCTPTATIGSIGAICCLLDRSGEYEEEGIKVEIFSSDGTGQTSPLKAMGTPGKPVTDPEREFLQGITHEYAAAFRAAVLARRPMATGQSFAGGWVTGRQAVADHLVDANAMNLEKLLAVLSAGI